MTRFPRITLLALLLALGATAHAAGLNDTGQTLCYDTSGATVSCAGSGQDGQYGRDPANAAGQITKIGAGAAGFDFTKIANNGSTLGAGVALGSNPTDWACTQDNVTGLTWEVKTTSGLRSKDNTYTWYSTDNASNGGYAGTANGGTCTGSNCDTGSFVAAVNAATLCGHNDWHLPTQRELLTLVYASGSSPSIDPTYFPNTPASVFWSGSSYAVFPTNAWGVYFFYGVTYAYAKADGYYYVRLVALSGSVAPTPATVTGVSSGSTYNASVTPTWTDAAGTTSTATLDGAAYTKGTAISANGVHTLVVTTTKTSNGLTALTTINFTVNAAPTPATVTGVSSGSTYNASVTPTWTDAAGTTSTATLDGAVYTKGTAISANGAHTLVVTTTKTSNGLTALTTINFTVNAAPTPATVTGVSSGSTYNASVTPTWTDAAGTTSTATLDGAAYTKGTAISANGVHTLVVTTTKTSNGLTALTTINFTVNIAPPTTIAGPTAMATGLTSTTLYVAIDKNGTGYYLVQAAAATAPTVAAVLVGTPFGMSANSATPFVISGLTASTAYKIYFVAKDNANHVQAAVQSAAFTTATDGYVSWLGLTWMPTSSTRYTYAQAVALCAGTIKGQTGWRLPTHAELLNFYAEFPNNSISLRGLGWASPSDIWSSTPVPPPAFGGQHYGVSLYNGGDIWFDDTSSTGNVSCVH